MGPEKQTLGSKHGRKRDRARSFFSALKNRSSAPSRSPTSSIASGTSALLAGQTSNSTNNNSQAGRVDSIAGAASQYDNIHQEAFERFKAENARGATALGEFIKPNQSSQWHEDVVNSLSSLLDDAKKDKTKIKLHSGEPLIVSDLLAKSTQWVKTMIAVGDSVIQYDPVHAALPWAAFRFVLQSAINYSEAEKAVWEGIASTCFNLSWIYLQRQLYLEVGRQDESKKHLHESCLDFYVAVFGILANLVRHLQTRKIASFNRVSFLANADYSRSWDVTGDKSMGYSFNHLIQQVMRPLST